MRIVIPLPFGEVAIHVRKMRRARPLFWYTLLSAAFHIVALTLVTTWLVQMVLHVPQPKAQAPPMLVTISSAQRIAPRPHPVRARHPRQQPEHVQPQQQPRIARVERAPPQAQRPELSTRKRVAYVAPKMQTLTPRQIDEQTRAFQQTIAEARRANDPVAGAANDAVTPAAPKRYALNIQGDEGKPTPEGILYPLKRWTDGPYVYYYVRYDAVYADGTPESGDVPWPIRFPIADDPFAKDRHRMPLPGPLPDYVLPSGVTLAPLVKNCYDHHYEYCPIAREAENGSSSSSSQRVF